MCVPARTAFFFYVTHRSGGAVITHTRYDATEDVHIDGDKLRIRGLLLGEFEEKWNEQKTDKSRLDSLDSPDFFA